MKLATFKTAQGASYGAVTAKGIVDLRRYLGNQYPDLKSLIAGDALRISAARGPAFNASTMKRSRRSPRPSG